jgi:hypothetical protein
MRFLRRNQLAGSDEGIAAFWRWWPTAAPRIAASIAAGADASIAEEISRAVHAIDGRLAWELSAGVEAEHAFVVSPDGNPEARPTARAWLASAVPADAAWEFHASRQPGPLGILGIGGEQIPLESMRAIAGWDEVRELVNIRLWHPALASLPDDARMQVAYLFLDNLLGEEGVERWVGTIDVSEPTSAV